MVLAFINIKKLRQGLKKTEAILITSVFNKSIDLINYLTNFLYLIRLGIKSPPKRFFLLSSYSLKPPSKK